MTAIANLPDIRPSLLLDFANSGRVDPRISFSRASTATYFDSNGVMRTAAAGVPRIDFDPTTGKCRGLLVEQQRTNFLTYSEQFDNAAWIKGNSSVTLNAITAPDGTLTADALIEDTSINQHFAIQTKTLLANTTYTMSVYVKPAGRTLFRLSAAQVNSWSVASPGANFDLMAGTVSGIVGESAGIQPVGDGWYRCYLVSTFGAANASGGIAINIVSSSGGVYQGDGTSGIYIWGAQLEAGSFHTSYIPTTDSQVTRAADLASMTGTNFSDWYRQDEGTFVVAAVSHPSAAPVVYFSASSGMLNGTGIAIASENLELIGRVRKDVSQNSSIGSYGCDVSTAFKSAVSYQAGNNGFVVNGNVITASNITGLPEANTVQLRIGAGGMGGFQPTTRISSLKFYPKRLTNEQLQRLTAL